ncbi:MAG: DUF4838 domain-containing protein, partial [Thermogutta sp.]
ELTHRANGSQCVCKNCRASDPPDGAPWRYYYKTGSIDYVAMTDRYVTFWNHLAAKLRERYSDSDVLVGVSAYGPSMPPPVAARLAENTVLRYVGHFPFTTEASRAEQKAQWVEWAKTARHMFYRSNLWYWGGGLWGWPEVAMTKTAEDFRFLAENRCMGLAVDTAWEHWATQGPQYYLMAQLGSFSAKGPLRPTFAILSELKAPHASEVSQAAADLFRGTASSEKLKESTQVPVPRVFRLVPTRK